MTQEVAQYEWLKGLEERITSLESDTQLANVMALVQKLIVRIQKAEMRITDLENKR